MDQQQFLLVPSVGHAPIPGGWRENPLPADFSVRIAGYDRSELDKIVRTEFDMSSSWGCPYEQKGLCSKVDNRPCDPGMKGCVLYGRFAFSNPEKNSPAIKRQLQDSKPKKEG